MYDVIVIGGGSAGFSAAEVAANTGASVCIIEKGRMGGECPNWACVPTKALLRSAKLYHEAKNDLKDFGIHASSVSFSFKEIMARKDAVVSAITGKGKKMDRIAKELGIDVVRGSAVFVDDHTVRVGKNKYKGKSIILATGTTTFVPPIDGLKKSGYLTFHDAVSLTVQPKSIAIIGGGPVGCEFATFFAMLGTQVKVLQLSEQVLQREDSEIGAIAGAQLQEIGVDIKLSTKTLSVKKEGKRVRVEYQVGAQKRQSILVDHVLLAAGKRAAVTELSLDKAGVKLDEVGRLHTDEYQRTNIKHIFAAGDVDGGMQFTHTAHLEGTIAAHNALSKTTRSMKKRDMRVVPRATFIHPEVASVGITAKEAADRKIKVEVAKFPVGGLGRSVTDNNRVGIIKIVVEKKTGLILGGHMIGACAGEVIHEIALGMHLGATAKDLSTMIHAFPTYSESIAAALGRYE